MERRAFLRLLALGVANHTLDLDRLLWVPGAKKIFIPAPVKLVELDIINIELERIIPKIHHMFEKDSIFYEQIIRGNKVISSQRFEIPFKLDP